MMETPAAWSPDAWQATALPPTHTNAPHLYTAQPAYADVLPSAPSMSMSEEQYMRPPSPLGNRAAAYPSYDGAHSDDDAAPAEPEKHRRYKSRVLRSRSPSPVAPPHREKHRHDAQATAPSSASRSGWIAEFNLPLWRLPLVWPSSAAPRSAAVPAGAAVAPTTPEAVEHVSAALRASGDTEGMQRALVALQRTRDEYCRLAAGPDEAMREAPQALQSALAYIGALEAVLAQTGAERAHAGRGEQDIADDDVSWLARRMRWPLHARSPLLYWRNEADELVKVNTLGSEWLLATQSAAALATFAAQRARDTHQGAEYLTLAAGALEAVAHAAADMATCTPDSAAATEAAYARFVRLPTLPVSSDLVAPLFATERAALRLAATAHQLLARIVRLSDAAANDADDRTLRQETRYTLLALFRAAQTSDRDVVGDGAARAYVDAVRDATQAARLLADATPGGAAWSRVPDLYYSAYRHAERAVAGNADGIGGRATQMDRLLDMRATVDEIARMRDEQQQPAFQDAPTLSASEDVSESASLTPTVSEGGGNTDDRDTEDTVAWRTLVGLPRPLTQWRERVGAARHAFLKQHHEGLHVLASGELARQQTAQRRADAAELQDGPYAQRLGDPLAALLRRLTEEQHGMLAAALELAAIAGGAHALARREVRAAGGDQPAIRAPSELTTAHSATYQRTLATLERLLPDLLLVGSVRNAPPERQPRKARSPRRRRLPAPPPPGARPQRGHGA